MLNPPHDSLADYLEAHSLLETLHNRKGRLLEAGESTLPSSLAESESLIALVDAGIEKAGALVVQYEQQIEGTLQVVADDADLGRALFLDISERISEFYALLSEHADELTEDERLRWACVVEDYMTLHTEWAQKMPPEDCPPPLQ
jgi:hypothetical protein